MKKNKWPLTPSPPKILAVLVLVLFFLTLSASSALAQGSDNLVRLKSGGKVWKVASILQLTDPVDLWNIPNQWKFVTREDSTFYFRVYDNNCGVDVVSLLNSSDNNNQSQSGVVFLDDLDLSNNSDQVKRLKTTIQRHSAAFWPHQGELVKTFNCLVKWDKATYADGAFQVFWKIAEEADSCQKKEEFYRKADDLGFRDSTPDQLRWLVEDFEKRKLSCAVIKKDALTAFNLVGYAPRSRSASVSLAVSPAVAVPTILIISIATAVVVVPPSATVASVPQTMVVERVITTTPAPATATKAPTPTATSTPSPTPTRKPGEKDLGEKIGDFFFWVCILLFLAGLLIACIIGLVYRRRRQEGRKQAFLREQAELMRRHAEESALKFAQLRQKAEELLALEELAADQVNELRVVIIPSLNDLRMYHPDGEDAGAKMCLRLKQELRSKKVKK